MSEDKTGNPEIAAPVGETPHPPGLLSTSHQLSDLVDKVKKLEGADNILDSIRATILLNFGNNERNVYGVVLSDETASTFNLFMDTINQLATRP